MDAEIDKYYYKDVASIIKNYVYGAEHYDKFQYTLMQLVNDTKYYKKMWQYEYRPHREIIFRFYYYNVLKELQSKFLSCCYCDYIFEKNDKIYLDFMGVYSCGECTKDIEINFD